MLMRHATRGLEVSDMQRCTCAIEDLEEEDRKCKALISCDNVPSAMHTSGDDKQEKEREDITILANNYSFFSSSCGNVPFYVTATRRTSGHNEKVEEEEKMDMNICACTDSSSTSSWDDVPSSIVAATCKTTSGNVVTHSGASLPINNKEDKEKEGGDVEGVASTARTCILIMPISREEDEDGVGCVTPKAREHRIPEPLVCPPPPQKKLKKHGCGHNNAANPKVNRNSYKQYGSHSFFNPPPDLHTYPNSIKASTSAN